MFVQHFVYNEANTVAVGFCRVMTVRLKETTAACNSKTDFIKTFASHYARFCVF